MNTPFNTIGFIGAGNMAEAILAGIIRNRLYPSSSVFLSDIRKERLDTLCDLFGTSACRDNGDLFSKCDIVVLSVKPQQIEEAFKSFAEEKRFDTFSRKLFISIAAGYRIRKIEAQLYPLVGEQNAARIPIVRVMPNTPCLVGKGMAGICANRHATEADMTAASAIFESVGKVRLFSESELDAVTALSGSGPAYVFYLAEAMIAAGRHIGLTHEDATTLTLATIEGAASLLLEEFLPPEELRRRVTSPGGTTEAAIRVFSDRSVKESLMAGIAAAAERAGELG